MSSPAVPRIACSLDEAFAGCVMLNQGPRILEAISVLDDILRRMARHHRKQRPLLPQLRAADYVHTNR